MSGIDTGRSGLEGDFSIEVLADVVPEGWVLEALGDMGPRKLRGRTLSAPFMVWFVILMGLHRRTSYENLLEWIRGTWWGRRMWRSGKRPGSSAISKARDRIGVAPVRSLFERTAGLWANRHAGVIVNGRRVLALDGLTYKVADSAANRDHFGLPGSSRGRSAFPQMRSVHLLDIGTRTVRDVEPGPYSDGELTVTRRLLPRIPIGSLLLMDRNFLAYEVLFKIHRDRSSDFVVRAKKCIKPSLVKELSAGDEIVDLKIPQSARRQDRRLPSVWRMRRVTFVHEGDSDKDPMVLLTTILDPAVLTKEELVELYLRRWEIETSNDELKTHLASCATVNCPAPLRSTTPDRVLQELYGFLIAYNAIRQLMCESGKANNVDPLRISFVASLQRVREANYEMNRLPSCQLPPRYAELLGSVARILVPLRPGRRVRREVKVKMSKYPVKRYRLTGS